MLGGGMEEIPPNRTLFVSRLPGKVSLGTLKRNLYLLFSQYGRVSDLIVPTGNKTHGQAFVVFQDFAEAVRAKQALNDFFFIHCQIRVAYSKNLTIKSRSSGMSTDLSPDAPANVPRPKTERPIRNASIDESNKILFIENLPENFDNESVANLFRQHQGYRECRMVSGHTGIAFVEFADESFASIAKNIMNNHRIDPTHELHISFAKK